MLVRRLLWPLGLLLGPATALAEAAASPPAPAASTAAPAASTAAPAASTAAPAASTAAPAASTAAPASSTAAPASSTAAPAASTAAPAASSTGFTIVDDTEPLPPVVPPARDTLGGHFVVGASALVTAPFGELQTGYSAQDLGAGFGALLDVGFGLSRVVSLGLWGEGLAYSNSSACRFWHRVENPARDPCSATSFTVGPFVRYHLLQGMRLDPWVLIGPGYRVLTQDTPEGSKRYAGVEYLHAAIGGDYYFTSGFALGPWVGLDGGVLAKRPNPVYGPGVKTAWHTEFVAGLRVTLDIPGK